MFHENAIEAEVREWISEFETEKNEALSILLNLFLASSGAAESLTTEMVSNSDAIDKHLTAILKNFDPVFLMIIMLILGRAKWISASSKGKGKNPSEIQKEFGWILGEIND